MAKKIVLAGACRTAIGTMGGELSTVPAPELGAIVIKEALKRAGVAPEAVDQVYMGCVIQAGQGQNVARQAALKVSYRLKQIKEDTGLPCEGIPSFDYAVGNCENIMKIANKLYAEK